MAASLLITPCTPPVGAASTSSPTHTLSASETAIATPIHLGRSAPPSSSSRAAHSPRRSLDPVLALLEPRPATQPASTSPRLTGPAPGLQSTRPRTRPLSMSTVQNLPSPGAAALRSLTGLQSLLGGGGEGDEVRGVGTSSSRLKRLSLVPTIRRSEDGAGSALGGPKEVLEENKNKDGDEERYRPASAMESRTAGDGAVGLMSPPWPPAPPTPSTPRSARRGVGLRSSISYSPAPRPAPADSMAFLRDMRGEGGNGYLDGAKRGKDISEELTDGSRSVEGSGTESERQGRERHGGKRGVTLSDKHAGLLTLIAQKERKVSELRQELAQQEASLSQLKSKWTALVSRSTQPSTTTASPPAASQPSSSHSHASGSSSANPAAKPHRTARPSSTSSTSASGSSRASLSLAALPEAAEHSESLRSATSTDSLTSSLISSSSTSLALVSSRKGRHTSSLSGSTPAHGLPDEPTWTALISNAIGQDVEGLLGVPAGVAPALNEGRRFWGKLVETVAAAAGGTVPGALEEGRERQLGEEAGRMEAPNERKDGSVANEGSLTGGFGGGGALGGDPHLSGGTVRWDGDGLAAMGKLDLSSLKQMIPLPAWALSPPADKPGSSGVNLVPPPAPANAARLPRNRDLSGSIGRMIPDRGSSERRAKEGTKRRLSSKVRGDAEVGLDGKSVRAEMSAGSGSSAMMTPSWSPSQGGLLDLLDDESDRQGGENGVVKVMTPRRPMRERVEAESGTETREADEGVGEEDGWGW